MESILTSIKKLLGISEEYVHFDNDIIILINTVLSDLNAIGVGPSNGFSITGDVETWDNLVSDDEKLNNVKTYVFLRVKLLFDPPTQSSVLESYQRQADKLEWLLNVVAETPKTEV
jgi:hypothetical protein